MIFQKIFILSAALGLQSSAQVCPGQNEDLCPVIEKSMTKNIAMIYEQMSFIPLVVPSAKNNSHHFHKEDSFFYVARALSLRCCFGGNSGIFFYSAGSPCIS